MRAGHAGPDSRRRVGSVSTSVAPLSAVLGRRVPPFSSAKPRAIARPSPSSRPPLAAPERLEHGLELRSRRYPARRRRREPRQSRSSGAAVIANAPGGSCMAVRVLEQVDQDPADMRCIDLDRRQIGRHIDRDGAFVVELVERRADELVHRPELALRIGGAGLEPREIEQIARPSRRGERSRS